MCRLRSLVTVRCEARLKILLDDTMKVRFDILALFLIMR